ncbi:MAG: DNA replication complex GINS family protein [Candidatus Diapherotrites archaeon]|nr:DNA replication complex GINS family protein [Candidatus Diapherotrites archaeon]
MGITFEYLREIQRKERNSSRIAEIEPKFYSELAAYVKTCTKECKDSGDGFRELENSMKLARDVFDKREQKLVMKALRSVRTKEYDDEHMTAEEKKLFKALVDAIRGNKKFFDRVMLGDYSLKVADEDTLIKENGNNVVLARVRKEIPVFVGSDTKEYGPYKSGDIVKLPRAEAELLAKQDLVEVM